MSKFKHTITISFTTDDILPDTAVYRLAGDMEVQIESLSDGTYEDENVEVNSVKNISTSVKSEPVE